MDGAAHNLARMENTSPTEHRSAGRKVHRLKNSGKEPLVFIEVQFGDYLEEDDVVRLHDDFSRA